MNFGQGILDSSELQLQEPYYSIDSISIKIYKEMSTK